MSEEDVREFIYARMSARPEVRVVSVSVRKYPSEYSATIWLDQAPTPEVRQHVYELEAELANPGIACSILVRSDQERPFGGIDTLERPRSEWIEEIMLDSRHQQLFGLK
jgi:hypothetical protein